MVHFGGFSTYVANNAVFVRRKKGAFGISFSASYKRYCFTLKHFLFLFLILVTSQREKKALKVTKYAEKIFL